MPNIYVSDPVLEALREHAEPFVDKSPNDVLERLLGMAGSPTGKRPQSSTTRSSRRKRVSGNHLTRHDLAPVVVEVLSSMGGECRVRDVLELVENRVEDRLNDNDKEILSHNNFSRWESETRFAREVLLKQGVLESGGHGIWRLTDKGHREAAALTKRGSDED